MSTDPIRCLIADDHPLMREVLGSRVVAAGLAVVGEAGDGAAAIASTVALRPDVLLLDLRLQQVDGFGVLAALAGLDLQTRVLVLATGGTGTTIRRAMQAGAVGFFDKASSQQVFEQALDAVSGGHRFIDPRLAADAWDRPAYTLSSRELEVLTLLCDGHSNKVIAASAGISQDTVKTHVSSVLGKLNVSNRSGAIATAIREQLVA